jgi:hypothetical protein
MHILFTSKTGRLIYLTYPCKCLFSLIVRCDGSLDKLSTSDENFHLQQKKRTRTEDIDYEKKMPFGLLYVWRSSLSSSVVNSRAGASSM